MCVEERSFHTPPCAHARAFTCNGFFVKLLEGGELLAQICYRLPTLDTAHHVALCVSEKQRQYVGIGVVLASLVMARVCKRYQSPVRTSASPVCIVARERLRLNLKTEYATASTPDITPMH